MINKTILLPILLITLIIAPSVTLFAQALVPDNDTIPESVKKVEDPFVEADEFSSMERELEELDSGTKSGDTTKIRIGSMKIQVVEDGDDIIINKDGDWDDEDWDDDWSWNDNDDWTFHRNRDNDRFKPHWGGMAIGFNNYVTSDYSTNLPADQELLAVNTNTSMEFSLNVGHIGLNIVKDYVGLVSGVGFKWNNYKFRNPNTVLVSETTPLTYYEDSSNTFNFSKLTTCYLIAPLLIEFQIPTSRDIVYLSVGVEGGIKLGAWTKKKTGDKGKVKDKSDYHTTSFDYRATARAGYGAFGFYATLAMMPLFVEDKGPELYPVAMGISFNY